MKDKKVMAAIGAVVVLILIFVLFNRQMSVNTADDISVQTAVTDDSGNVNAYSSDSKGEDSSDIDQSDGRPVESANEAVSEESAKDKEVGEASNITSDTADDRSSDGYYEDNNYQGDEGNQGEMTNHSISSQRITWDNIGIDSPGNENPEVSPTPGITEDISFPYSIPDRNLVVRKISAYDGIFLEDGSDTEVEGIAAIILENTGDEAVEYAEVELSGTAGQFVFICTDIPAGGVAVVQEKEAAAMREDISWRRCEAAVARLDELEMSEGEVIVTEGENNSLIVENISNKDIPVVRIYYKFYSEENDAYVGGITYTVKISDLTEGSKVTVSPSHYATGFSKVLMVRIYDTDEG